MQEESKDEQQETTPADSAESNPPEPTAEVDAAQTPEADALPGADQDDSLQAAEGETPAAPAEDEPVAPADEAPLVEDELAPQTPPVTDATSEQPDGLVEGTAEDLAAESQAIDPKIDIGLLEAYLFSTHSPLTGGKLAELFNLESTKPIRKAVRLLNEQYEQTGRCFRVEQVAGGFQLLTLPTYGEPLKALHQKEQDAKLTKAALETLAIIAYKQPILRADVEAIRGVASGETIRSLMEKHLVKIAGRAEEPGRPILYGTTKRFLEVFGLNSLKDLPQPEALAAKAQQSQIALAEPTPAAEAAPESPASEPAPAPMEPPVVDTPAEPQPEGEAPATAEPTAEPAVEESAKAPEPPVEPAAAEPEKPQESPEPPTDGTDPDRQA